MDPVDVPSTITVAWVQELQKTLDAATRAGTQALQQVLPFDVVAHLIGRAERLFKEEAALVEVRARGQGSRYTQGTAAAAAPDREGDPGRPPVLLQIQVAEAATVTVVGDTHGQFHDVCKLCVALSLGLVRGGALRRSGQ